MQCYKRILQLDPENIQGLHNLCVVYVERGNLLRAEACLTRAHRLAPNEDYVLRHLNIVQSRINKHQIQRSAEDGGEFDDFEEGEEFHHYVDNYDEDNMGEDFENEFDGEDMEEEIASDVTHKSSLRKAHLVGNEEFSESRVGRLQNQKQTDSQNKMNPSSSEPVFSDNPSSEPSKKHEDKSSHSDVDSKNTLLSHNEVKKHTSS